MKKIKRIATGLLVSAFFLVNNFTIQAQSGVPASLDSWENLKAIPPGDEVAIDLKTGQKMSGRMAGVSDTAVTITRGKGRMDLVRADIGRVRRTVPKSPLKETLVGLGIGAGTGVALGAAAASAQLESGEAGFAMLVFGSIGSGIGALSGFIVGMRRERVLVYESK